MKKTIISTLLAVCSLTSCVDLNIAPKNFVSDNDLMSSESGMNIYMARMYSYMPFEDFKYMAKWGLNFNSWLGALGIEGTGEALNRASDLGSAFTGEDTPYWGTAFTTLRDANYLLERLPDFQSNFAEVTYNHYLGEAYFVRAMVFYAMARRFGGIPLVTRVIEYPASSDKLEVARSSEEQTWDQILADFDNAARLLNTTSLKEGYANKYVALAFKSEAMLYAGCVAKYNETVSGRLTGLGEKTGVRVIGFDAGTWEAASKRYFREAYKAAREVMTEGGYSLYKKKWAAGDPEAQYQNMVEMFSDLSSPENILVKQYSYPTMTHGLDAYSSPYIFRSPLSAGTCPTLDFLELFDGFDRYDDGTVRVTDGVSNAQGNYLLYDSPMDFFKNAEPRLRAYVIFPGDQFKSQEIEVRAGVYTGSTPIKPFFSDYSYNSYETPYEKLSLYTDASNKQLYLSPNADSQQEKVEYNGSTMTAAGANGPFYNNGEATVTGLYLRKYLKDDPSFTPDEGKSDQPFILMRYAEVMLNAAEAAVELALAGEPSPDGSDLMQVATDAVNEIRERAGAELLESNIQPTTEGRNIVRKERRKELAFEHKTKWDLRRWRVWHYEGRDGFWGETRDKNTYSNNASYRFRGLYPFFSTQAGKWFFDAHFHWVSRFTPSFSILDYYFAIPSGEVSKSSYIDQQPNR